MGYLVPSCLLPETLESYALQGSNLVSSRYETPWAVLRGAVLYGGTPKGVYEIGGYSLS